MRIDLHCHLLWGIDDGAESIEDTLALCETAVGKQNPYHCRHAALYGLYRHRGFFICAQSQDRAAQFPFAHA